MTMDWDKLKVFHAAAEAGSFTHAGEQLGLSQSAVSRQVSALEQELALLGEDQSARVAMKQRDRELLLERAHLARHGRLRQAELLARMGEAAGFGAA